MKLTIVKLTIYQIKISNNVEINNLKTEIANYVKFLFHGFKINKKGLKKFISGVYFQVWKLFV